MTGRLVATDPDNPNDDPKVKNYPLRSIVGILLYMTNTRYDLKYAVNQLARYVSNPNIDHVNAANKLLQYVKGTIDYGITFGIGPKEIRKFIDNDNVTGKEWKGLVAFADSDFAGDIDTRRSVRGFIIYYNGDPISSKSKLDTTVSLSTGGAEVSALALLVQEVIWLRLLFQELGDTDIATTPTPIFEDNESCIKMVKEPSQLHSRTKHLAIRKHWIHDQIRHKNIRIIHIKTHKQIADIFTKPLASGNFEKLRRYITHSGLAIT